MVPPKAIAADQISSASVQAGNTRRIPFWPISYTSIESTVCILDIVLIVVASVTGGAIYSRLFHINDVEISRHIATAAVVCAVFVPLFRNRGLYDPSALVNWGLQARKIIVLWI